MHRLAHAGGSAISYNIMLSHAASARPSCCCRSHAKGTCNAPWAFTAPCTTPECLCTCCYNEVAALATGAIALHVTHDGMMAVSVHCCLPHAALTSCCRGRMCFWLHVASIDCMCSWWRISIRNQHSTAVRLLQVLESTAAFDLLPNKVERSPVCVYHPSPLQSWSTWSASWSWGRPSSQR